MDGALPKLDAGEWGAVISGFRNFKHDSTCGVSK